MRKINLTDVTIRESARNEDTALSFREKVEMAKLMDRLNYATVELPRISDVKTDSLLIKTMTASVSDNKIACQVGLDPSKVREVWECLKNAKRPVLSVALPVSAVGMEYICGRKPSEVTELISELVSECAKYCDRVEFSAQDASRADFSFLESCIAEALKAGATKICICDSSSELLPDEMKDFVVKIRDFIDREGGKDIQLAVEVSDRLGTAAACVFSAVQAGADEIKTALDGFDFPNIEKVADIIEKRGSDFNVFTTIRKTELVRGMRALQNIRSGQKHGLPAAYCQADGTRRLSLNINDSAQSVSEACAAIGYDLSYEDKANVYEAFLRVARKKQYVGTKELEAIIASTALSVPATYKIDSYVINSGNIITATANIQLDAKGNRISAIATGDGPIAAAFNAVDKILGHHYELDDFQIQAVTEGREAMGSALVKLRTEDGRLYSGTGISTDIIGASIRAYVSAVNKICYEGSLKP